MCYSDWISITFLCLEDKAFLLGVSICFQVFRKFGVVKYDPTNEQFDPNRHNAVFQLPDPSKPPGTVAVVLKVTNRFYFFLSIASCTQGGRPTLDIK